MKLKSKPMKPMTVKEKLVWACSCLLGVICAFLCAGFDKQANVPSIEPSTVAVTELTTVIDDVTVTTTETLIDLTTVKYEDIPEYIELGIFKITHCCICQECCGKAPDHPEYGITATGTRVEVGRTVAVDPSVIPYGTELMINGETYIAEDTGGSVIGNVVDIYVSSHAEADELGVKYAKVFEVVG